jgi:hypothetical protein
MSPSSTPSPKKRQLPSIPLEAQMKSRDRGILNVKLEPSVYSLTPQIVQQIYFIFYLITCKT